MSRFSSPVLSFLIVLSLSLFNACHPPAPKGQDSLAYFEWTDSYERAVSLTKVPQRIISLSPSITEMIFLLESEDLLVGISDFCEYPEGTRQIKKVGGMQNFNIEYLLSLNPDIVFIGSIVSKEDVEKIEMMGIPVIAIKEEQDIRGIFLALNILGKILQKEELASVQVEKLQNQLDAVTSALPSTMVKPSVYFVVGFGEAGDYTAPANSHIHEIITLAGGKNVGESLSGWSISREYLFREDPDIIMIRKENKEKFCQTFPYSELKAVKQHHVYPIESGWIDIVSPRNILAIQEIHQHINELY